jgi:uncharacterized protein (TIGR04255 family)
MDKFTPLHEAHAIEQVAFVIQMDGLLTLDEFNSVRTDSEQFKDKLPGFEEAQPILFLGQPIGPNNTPLARNNIFRRKYATDGSIELELGIQPNGLTFRTTRYTRWSDVWQSASDLLDKLYPIYSNGRRPMLIALNYVDKFVSSGPSNNNNAYQLLKNGSKYVAGHVLNANDLWHSHTGIFLQENTYTKRLLNINLDCLDENASSGPRRSVAIATSLTDMLNQPGYKELPHSRDRDWPFICETIRNLHNFNKTVISEILSEEMCKRIALNA